MHDETTSLNGWHFWIDRGGTFTDVVARDPSGNLHVKKLLSENPHQYLDAPTHAIREILGLRTDEPIPGSRISTVKMGTTLATNALLERKGARVAFLVTKGFADLLEIGYQNRPDLFALNIEKPSMLYERVSEIDERMSASGEVCIELDESRLIPILHDIRNAGIDSLAVLLLHSYANPDHELRIERIAVDLGFAGVFLSHRTAREIKAVARGDTTVADAYLTPIIRRYVDQFKNFLSGDVPLRFMQSNGGLADAERFSGKDAILSGPAGGVVAYAHVSRLAGFENVIGFDMGGTSTDVSRYGGRFERIYEKTVAGVRVKAPMMHIETVAAGGGSILAFDGRRMTVGPESAGAYPGPACYRNGGPATITDANLILGRVQAEFFPSCFGPDADQPLDVSAARERIRAIAAAISESTGTTRTVEETAAGFIRIANENMAKPIKEISVARGYDVQEHVLACFGGAGAQHACALASLLGIRSILLHPMAGVLSAYGMGLADMAHMSVAAVLLPLNLDTFMQLEGRFKELEADGRSAMIQDGYPGHRIQYQRSLDIRYFGVDAYLNVPYNDYPSLVGRFESEHRQLFGYLKTSEPLEIVNIRVETLGITDKPHEAEISGSGRSISKPDSLGECTIFFDEIDDSGRRTSVPVPTAIYLRSDLHVHSSIEGPALVVEDTSTIVVDPGWLLRVSRFGHIVLEKSAAPQKKERLPTECDPVILEVFNNLFMSIAEQMGRTLERVSHSVNIKERLDFSCAIFTPQGELVANAHHIPVHLGSMSESVKAILLERAGSMKSGDVYVSNDPYHGGSHLPDITVVSPVFNAQGQVLFVVANRGHHADIGGIAPGSMPPFSKSLHEEGIVIRNFLLVSNGHFRESELIDLLGGKGLETRGPIQPARNIPERLSDIRAQIAANTMGVQLLNTLCEKYSVETVHAYMHHVRENAATAMREILSSIPDGVYRFHDGLDCGARIQVSIEIACDRATVDFAGTDPQLESNLNAPPSVTLAAVLYVFRTLVRRPIPLNSGCIDPIEIRIPKGSLLCPDFPAPVVGGNVETSQRVVDVLFGALGVLAASQGTMNNFSFGNDRFGYYETICGGAGAGANFVGASAVHSHMTNTRITDPEVLEHRYPVVLREFSIRRKTGGRGKNCGGDGVRRAIEFRSAVTASLLTERRETQPFGLNGGRPGASGRNVLVRDEREETLPGHTTIDVQAGDSIIIETPGGGGFGAP